MTAHSLIPVPISRNLRIFAFDPGVSAQFDMASVSEITINVEWENLQPGPIGEYLEVIDVDPSSGLCYKPVDLNDVRILAQSGLAPSESNPQFHQQMVYAVAMNTIRHFEQALGRVALWCTHRRPDGAKQFVRRLRIYPHALRDRNAYYSQDKKALLFGYFPVGIKDATNTPGTLVFTCLSHDIIAHETTHALLDGVHPRFDEPVNLDVLAFHEAFADVVALFQHFSYPGVLRDQISRTRGDLTSENILGELAQQFGKASGRGKALRNALGGRDKTSNVWKLHTPDVHALEHASEPHDRGAILVAAIFGAFLKVYRVRTVDLYRIASEGTGVLRAGDIHPDLANRFAAEAARCAQQILQMCIRAIDYCPPVGITFGDYLRAVVTADTDFNPDDPSGYRLAFVESFRQWGIYPAGMRSMSVESLLWSGITAQLDSTDVASLLHEKHSFNDQDMTENQPVPQSDTSQLVEFRPWNLESDRHEVWKASDDNARIFWKWLMFGGGQKLLNALPLVLDNAPPTVSRSKITKRAAVEISSVRTSLRRSQRGGSTTDLVVEITQSRRGSFDEDTQKRWDASGIDEVTEDEDFFYRAGCTLIINPATMEVRRLIPTAGTINNDVELGRVRRFRNGDDLKPGNAFDFAGKVLSAREPFALVHRAAEE